MSIESLLPSNHLILFHPLLLPSVFTRVRIFSNESALHTIGQKIGASASVLPMSIHSGLISLGLTSLIFLQPKGLSRVFSNTTVQKYQFFSPQNAFVGKVMSLFLNMLFRLSGFVYLSKNQLSVTLFFIILFFLSMSSIFALIFCFLSF